MSSASCTRELAAWLGERVATARILVLWAALATVAWSVSLNAAPWAVAMSMALLVVQFRLWDDLAERRYDAARHPGRVAVRTTHVQFFAGVVAVLALPIAALLAATRGNNVLAGYGALLVAASVFYRKSAVATRHPWRPYVVLLKYPVFVVLCAGTAVPLRVAAAGAAVFGALAAFETLDDAALRAAPASHLLAAGLALLAFLGVTVVVMS